MTGPALQGTYLQRQLKGTLQAPFRMAREGDDGIQGCLEQT